MTKLGFLFLTLDNLSHSLIWEDFFKEVSQNKYKIICHAKYPNNVSDFLKNHLSANHTDTNWGCPSLVKATFIMMEEMLTDPEISHFFLLSHDSAPLVDLDTIYNFCEKEQKGSMRFIRNEKHSQWAIFPRSLVEKTIDNKFRLLLNYHKMLSSGKVFMCMDECWISLLFEHCLKEEKIDDYFYTTKNSRTFTKMIHMKEIQQGTADHNHYKNRIFFDSYLQNNFTVVHVYTFDEYIKIKEDLARKDYWFLRKISNYY